MVVRDGHYNCNKSSTMVICVQEDHTVNNNWWVLTVVTKVNNIGYEVINNNAIYIKYG